MAEARAYGVALRKRLDTAIRELVRRRLGYSSGGGRPRTHAMSPTRRSDRTKAAALTFVFRALFLLYAESAGYLPMARDAYARGSLTQVVRDAWEQRGSFDARSTKFWDRVQTLVRAMRSGDDALGVPPYNGDGFAPNGFEGSATLDAASLPDTALGPTLVALGIEADSGVGYEFRGSTSATSGTSTRDCCRSGCRLPIGHTATTSAASATSQPRRATLSTPQVSCSGSPTREVARAVASITHKCGAASRTRQRASRVRAPSRRGRAAPTRIPPRLRDKVFAFRVLDPACGSAHFLVAVVDELADRIARFLAEHPMPDVARDLVDLREEPALHTGSVSKTWCCSAASSCAVACTASISRGWAQRSRRSRSDSPRSDRVVACVPLITNDQVGNSLIGVATAEQLLDADGGRTIPAMLVIDQMERAAKATEARRGLLVRDPEEVARTEEADEAVKLAVEGARVLLDLWVADSLGLAGGGRNCGQLRTRSAKDGSRRSRTRRRALRRSTECCTGHSPSRKSSQSGRGFDAVVGNPPWEQKPMTDEISVYARYQPGLKGLPERERLVALARLKDERPEIDAVFRRVAPGDRVEALQKYFGFDTGYYGRGADPDLYDHFESAIRGCSRQMRFSSCGAPADARYGAKGPCGFRRWTFEHRRSKRIDFLLNAERRAFDAEPRYTVALLVARQPHSTERLVGCRRGGRITLAEFIAGKCHVLESVPRHLQRSESNS